MDNNDKIKDLAVCAWMRVADMSAKDECYVTFEDYSVYVGKQSVNRKQYAGMLIGSRHDWANFTEALQAYKERGLKGR